jgi:lysophospholipase L1-like esterase
MRPALWGRAACYASLFTCIIAAGAVCVLASRFDTLHASTQARLDRLADEIRFSSPADLGHKHTTVRGLIIQSQLAQAKGRPVVFVGDSITESAMLPSSLCGHPVVNAGLGGASTRSYLHFAQSVLPTLSAPLIVVALGTNDSQTAARKAADFVGSYIALLDFLKPRAGSIVLVGVPPLEMAGTLASGYFDQAAADENDRTIRKIAAANSLPFADVRTMTGENLTVDGVHLTPDGYAKWRAAVLSAASKALNCQSASN